MEITIRKEQVSDWHEAEIMTKAAFWNLHVPGCDEHYLVHLLRTDAKYIPELTRVAEVGGRVVGAIYYTKSTIRCGESATEVVTFGPLCVAPEFQKKGIGGKLLTETMQLARELGYKAIIIFGEPEYYPKFGFITCDNFGITTKEGKNIEAFMGIELVKGSLNSVHGKFYEAEVFEKLTPEKVAEYDKDFPYMEKLKLPKQWEE